MKGARLGMRLLARASGRIRAAESLATGRPLRFGTCVPLLLDLALLLCGEQARRRESLRRRRRVLVVDRAGVRVLRDPYSAKPYVLFYITKRVGGGVQDFDTINFRLAVVGLIAYTSAFVCEAIRSGINTVPVGQAEAARALGLNFTQVLTLVVLPQAFRSVVGPLANVLIALTKNTTVAAAIGVAEAALLRKKLIENEAQLLLISAVFAFGFVVLTLPTGLILGWVGKKVAVKR